MLLKNKVAVVTGGASGIGRAICARFAEEGALAVIVADLREDPAEGGEPVLETIRGFGCEARFVRTDVSCVADLERAVAAADAFGGVTTMVNNAGILRPVGFLETTEADYDLEMAVNAKGVFFGAQAAARSMIAGNRGGSIINLSSIVGLLGHAGDVTYCASKGGIKLMSYAMASALGPKGIRVNALHPGEIRTSLSSLGSDRDLQWTIPLGKSGTPRQVADGAVYLASDLSSYVTGTSLLVDGGIVNTFKGTALPKWDDEE